MKDKFESLTYEEAVSQLENILAELEGRDIALERTLELFEKGIELSKYCQNILQKTEQKVQGLTKDNSLET